VSQPPVYDAVLPNGLGLLLRESHLAAVAEFQIWAKVGSADERPGEEGLAHFHEHKAAVNSVAVSQDNQFFVSGSDDGTVKVSAVEKRQICHQFVLL